MEKCLYFSFHQKWSKLGTLLQTDANGAEMKKKLKISDSPPKQVLTVHFAEKERNLGYWCGKMLELRLNITVSKILYSYENNENTKNKVFVSISALLKIFKVDCYLLCKSTKVIALQFFNACLEDKHYRKQNSPQI